MTQATRCRTVTMAVAAAVALTAAGCGGGGHHATTPTTRAPISTAQEKKEIETDWVTFFDGKTPATRRVALLEDGSQFASVIQDQARSVLAQAASAKVSKVTLASPGHATVDYAIVEAGTTAVPHLTGTAVLQGGTWKVGVTSFCGLLTLEAGGKTSKLPPACHS